MTTEKGLEKGQSAIAKSPLNVKKTFDGEKSPSADKVEMVAAPEKLRTKTKIFNFKIKHAEHWLDASIGMTWGFAATIVAGTIIGIFGLYSDDNFFLTVKKVVFYICPVAIGFSIGLKMKFDPFRVLGLGIIAFLVGHSKFIPYYVSDQGPVFDNPTIGINFQFNSPGDVFAALIGATLAAYVFKIVTINWFLNIILVPVVAALLGMAEALSVTYVTSSVLVLLEWLIDISISRTRWIAILVAPFLGIMMGLALSLPISSAAIALSLYLSGDAATAAMAGTAAQTISFGLMTYLATKNFRHTLAVIFVTPMLHMKNYFRRPAILIVPSICSGIAALIAVVAFPLPFPNSKDNPEITVGMGSSALYGQIFTMKNNGWGNSSAWLNVILVQLTLPALITIPLGIFIFRKRWLRRRDMAL